MVNKEKYRRASIGDVNKMVEHANGIEAAAKHMLETGQALTMVEARDMAKNQAVNRFFDGIKQQFERLGLIVEKFDLLTNKTDAGQMVCRVKFSKSG